MSLDFFQKAMDFVEFSRSDADVGAVGIRFGELIREMGFSWFSCFGIRKDVTNPVEALYHLEYPEEWITYYWDRGYHFRDKIIEVALKTPLPFRWSSNVVQDKMTKTQRLIFDEAEDAELMDAVCVPVHVHGFAPGIVVVVSETPDIPIEAEHAIHMMALHLHDVSSRYHATHFTGIDRPAALTPREVECLKWVAAGKSDWEISEILACAESTVHNHVENAKRKLNVRTRSHAVSQAWLCNLLYH